MISLRNYLSGIVAWEVDIGMHQSLELERESWGDDYADSDVMVRWGYLTRSLEEEQRMIRAEHKARADEKRKDVPMNESPAEGSEP